MEQVSPLAPGAVLWADLGQSLGREQAGIRPCLVVSSRDHIREVDSLITVMPCTGQDRGWVNHVPLRGELQLHRPTYVMTEQVRTVSRVRLLRPIGYADVECLHQALEWLHRWTARVA